MKKLFKIFSVDRIYDYIERKVMADDSMYYFVLQEESEVKKIVSKLNKSELTKYPLSEEEQEEITKKLNESENLTRGERNKLRRKLREADTCSYWDYKEVETRIIKMSDDVSMESLLIY